MLNSIFESCVMEIRKMEYESSGAQFGVPSITRIALVNIKKN